MRDPQTKTIGTTLYEVTPLPAGKGLALLTRLARLLGPALAAAPSLAAVADAGGDVLAGLLANVTEEDTAHLCAVLAENTRVCPAGGQFVALKQAFDVHFQGDYLAMLEWVKFALEVNYAGFFAGIAAKVPAAKDGAKAPDASGAAPTAS